MLRKPVLTLPAFLLVLAGVTGCTSLPGPPFGPAAGCAPASEVNSRFNTLLLASGMGLSESDLMDLDDGPFQTVSPSVINPPQLRQLLRRACVYESQDAAPGFEDGTAWFVVTDAEVDHLAVEGLVDRCSHPSEREKPSRTLRTSCKMAPSSSGTSMASFLSTSPRSSPTPSTRQCCRSADRRCGCRADDGRGSGFGGAQLGAHFPTSWNDRKRRSVVGVVSINRVCSQCRSTLESRPCSHRARAAV